jgi:hypothetical protein
MKLLVTNANIWFNQQAITQDVIPNYVKVKISGNGPAVNKSKKLAEHTRIKQEIKFLYKKKALLNKQLYNTHLLLAKQWGNTWDNIMCQVNDELKDILDKKYDLLHKKLKALIDKKQHGKLQNTSDQQQNNKFYDRVVNLTPIQFDNKEIELLNKGLQYNMPYNNSKHWLERLIVETEVAISKLPEQHQEGFRFLAKQNIKKIMNNDKQNSNKSVEGNLVKTIKQKLIDNGSVITKADKGKTTVIISNQELTNKINSYAIENKLHKLTKDPTLKFQENVKSVLKSCTNIINKCNKHRYVQIKPLAPKLNTTIKLHKDGAPIRPVVNYRHAPAYNIAKFASHWLKSNYELPYTYNVQNSIQFANQIKNLHIQGGHKMMTLDISNLYTNIPVKEVIQIIEKKLNSNPNLNSFVKIEILRLIKTTTEQHYFTFHNNFWKQETGTPMGSPISSIIA